jgi:hypothetical protein
MLGPRRSELSLESGSSVTAGNRRAARPLCRSTRGAKGGQKQRLPRSWAQAWARIDRGETGDKIAHDDPAMPPLGTDAEAGGATTGPEDITRSAAQETPRVAAAHGEAPRAGGRLQLVPWQVVSRPLTAIAALRIAA